MTPVPVTVDRPTGFEQRRPETLRAISLVQPVDGAGTRSARLDTRWGA